MEDFEIISTYSRAQAIKDGVLVDVTETAKEAGIKFPVAMTAEVFSETVRWSQNSGMQDESGRLWDVVWMLRNAIRNAQGGYLKFVVYVVPNKPRCRKPQVVQLKAICGPGDNLEPVITIMLPEQD